MFQKRLWLFLVILTIHSRLLAQEKSDYSKNWEKIEGFEKKGLTVSALKEAINIFNLAVASGNDAQQVKSAMYQMKYRNMIEEDNKEKNIFYIDTLIKKSKAPAKNILQSMQAELFLGYRQNNRYKFYGRTQLSEEKSNDIATWSLAKLNRTTSALYKSSLLNENILKSISLNGYEAIIQEGKNTRTLRPTLYDLLAHRALDYFTDSENDITEASYKFILNDEKTFEPANAFAAITIITKDTSSLYYNALLLFQKLLQFHLADANPEPLIDVDLKRLAFVNEHGIFSNKDKLYEDALKNIETTYNNNPASAQAMYLRASLYKTQGEQYNPLTKKEFQFNIKRAKQLCEETIRKFPKSEGGLNCENLLLDIKTPSLSLESEKVNIPGQPFKSLLKYKNAATVYFRVIKISRDEFKRIRKDDIDNDEQWKEMISLKAIKSWSTNLPDLQDHQQHAVEVKTESLPAGFYIMLGSIDPGFKMKNNFLVRQFIYVSNISYISNSENEIYILNRNTGEPLFNSELQLWQSIYNSSSRKYEEVKKDKYIANKEGYIKLKKVNDNNYYGFYYQLKYKDDELFTDDNNYIYSYNSYAPKDVNRSFLFTDRSIYRPGQTLFFKGIVINTSAVTKKSSVISNYKTTLMIFDANNQVAGRMQVTTNDYGSYNGSFKLPEGKMNGAFYIRDSMTNANEYFHVEEYKRPKFLVEIKKPKGSYRINDSVQVNGIAKAYAGNNIDNAKVTFRVVRKVRYPDWWWWGSYTKIIPSYRNNTETEITNGETSTDMKGEFFISFKAIPDETVDKKSQPVFYYEISADITDINGETRSSSTSVAVAYQAIQINIIAAEKMPVDSLKNFRISSTNMNDLFEKVNLHLTIQKLQSPGKIFRTRYWEIPDQFIMSHEQFTADFPYDAYTNEDQVTQWPVLQKQIDITDSTTENSKFNIGNYTKPGIGWYKIIATTTDKYGEEVRSEKYILLTEQGKQIETEPVTSNFDKDQAEPGQEINYTIATGFEKISLVCSLTKKNNTTHTVYPVSSSLPYSTKILVSETDRGGMIIDYAFVQHNRVYTGSQYLNIPWSNKELKVSYETFRDKILPGSKENWKIRLTGIKAEKVAAEALISMYDESLDQYYPHNWNSLSTIWPSQTSTASWAGQLFKSEESEEQNHIETKYEELPDKLYDQLLNKGWSSVTYFLEGRVAGVTTVYIQNVYGSRAPDDKIGYLKADRLSYKRNETESAIAVPILDSNGNSTLDLNNKENLSPSPNPNPNVQIRKNFNETAFFFPALNTDANGDIEFSFTIPEALTTWKMMTLAHTKELASIYDEKKIITQKPLMVQPNAPRFLREGDRMEFSAKIVNLADSEMTGTAQLELFDAATNKVVDGWFKNMFPTQYFTVAAGQSTAVKFPVDIPFSFNSALTYRIKAISKDGSFSDGEEAALPVLTNRMLVTETMPLNMRNETTKNFKFEKLLNSNNSGSLTHHALTIEYSSNPAWYAIQALPYLMEYPYECAEQTFNRYYANTLASFVSNSIPKIKTVFEKWETTDTAALLSNLQKNEELKSALLEETPWVLQAQDESTQKKNIAILFNMVRLSAEKDKLFDKLKEMQTSNGGFSWFKGGRDDRYITQYIITGIGHLRKLNALSANDYQKLKPIAEKALPYLDARIKEDYDNLKKYKIPLKNNNLSNTAIQYLYMRSFFADYILNTNSETAYKYYREQSQQYWLSNGKYMQAMIALSLYRTGDTKTPQAIIASLKENAIYKEEMGMYFKELTNGGYYWYQSPIESQAMIIEAFTDIDKNLTTVNDLKTWLLKQKQTQNWKTTKATAEACYALLLNGSNWLTEEKNITINIGSTIIKSINENTEAGTGYFKKTISGNNVQQGMGNITVNVDPVTDQQVSKSTSWGAIYWQYFEDLDKITSAETPLKLVKKLFIEKNSDRGPVLEPVKDGDELHVGDKIKVRIELKADRDMEYIHMKDMRAACMEPVNVISQYKWQDGLGYYESTKDASTNFFFNWLPRGTYVFEYPMFVTHSGNFSNGISTIQCMYAPEFSSHSEGIRVSVSEK